MIFHPDSHLNKHGYFSVGDQNLYSKLDAIKLSVATGDPVKWHYNDEVFSKQDWTVEPEKDIRTMYQERAQAIRDKFDYVIVMFSGGADSTTVLDSFIDNGIPVDEIYMQHWIKYQPEKEQSFMNAEIHQSALPYLKRKLPSAWKTTVRMHDVSDKMLDLLRDPDFRERSYREVNNIHNLSTISWHYDLQNRFSKYSKFREQGKSIVFVWGEAKPKIYYDLEKNKHYFIFQDHYAHCPQPRDQELNDPFCQHEQFFDDPLHPEIKVKQCHLILNTLKQIAHRTDLFYPQTVSAEQRIIYSSSSETYHNGQKYDLDRNAFNCAIYPDWNFLTYHQDKRLGRLVHPAHAWVEQVEPDAAKKWFAGYINTYGQLPDEWVKYYGSLKSGTRRLEIPYYLE